MSLLDDKMKEALIKAVMSLCGADKETAEKFVEDVVLKHPIPKISVALTSLLRARRRISLEELEEVLRKARF